MSKLNWREVESFDENPQCREKIERKKPLSGGKMQKKTLHDKRKK